MRRGRRWALATGTTVGLAALWGATTVGPATASDDEVLRLAATTLDTRYPALVDVAGDVDATTATQDIGDSFILQNSLSGRGTDGRSRSVGQFTLVDDVSQARMASVVLTLKGGQVTLSGLVVLSREINTLAVTGGTGRYEEAQGEMTFDRKDAANVNNYVLRLED